jgi:putative membrane protein
MQEVCMNLYRILAAGSCAVLLAIPALAKSPKLSTPDRQFLKMAAVTDMTEAHLGEMAKSKAAMPGIKDFGQTLVKDHTQAYQQLAVVGSKLDQTIPNGINVRRDREVKQLTALKGKKFDSQFLRDEVQDHQRVIAAFKREAQHGQDQNLRAYASQELPTIEEHLREAEKLLKHPA